jgi:hypothetical protein
MNVRSAVLAALARLGACQSLLERIQQEAVLTTYDADVAYYYDAGLDMAAASDRQPGNNMRTEAVFYDTDDALRRVTLHGLQSERVPVQARYRTLALQTAGGSVAVFPAHFADTVQAIAHGLDWTPPFKSVLKAWGSTRRCSWTFMATGTRTISPICVSTSCTRISPRCARSRIRISC